MSLNPALEGARFCPRCGAEAEVAFPRSIACRSCGYRAFYNPKPVACAIPRDGDGRVWLMRRATEPARGRWTFPGGFVDLGESVEDAARREVREEAGVEGELVEKLGDVRYWYSRGGKRVMKNVAFFLLRYRSGSVADHDHEVDSAEWVPLEDAPRLLEYRGERDMAKAALSALRADR